MNTYERAAIALARANGAITAQDLAKKLRIGLVFARVVLKGLERRQIIERVDRLGRHKLIGPETDDVATANGSQTANARIADLEAKIERLRWAGRIGSQSA